MTRVAIDMDEVIADALGHHLSLYNAAFGANLTRADVAGKWLQDVVNDEHREAVEALVHREEFFANLPVVADSQEVIRELTGRYEVFITTAAMEVPVSFAAKYHWLLEHFPFLPSSHFVFCGDKSIIAADYLIDDTARHFRRFQGEGLLFTAPHNLHVTGYRRVDSWQDVRRLLL